MIRNLPLLLLLATASASITAEPITFKASKTGDKIHVLGEDTETPLVVQVAEADMRPYLHPIKAPDGKGTLTQYSPGHHRHQTGLYWGFTRVNGRDYFHHPKDNYWKRNALEILQAEGKKVRWRTTYELLDAKGDPILREQQTWSITGSQEHIHLDLNWQGTGRVDVTIGKYNYGGLFLRMPWTRQRGGTATNSEGQVNRKAEGKPARWVDVGMPIEGRNDWAHIAILDHPKNDNHPNLWRVDGQLGIGPCRARAGEWKIAKGSTHVTNHRLVVYTGPLDKKLLNTAWKNLN